MNRGRGSGLPVIGAPAGRRRKSRQYRVQVELTGAQVEMLLFFAEDQQVCTVRAQTCKALIAKGLIRREDGSPVYRVTELGQAVAAAVVRQA